VEEDPELALLLHSRTGGSGSLLGITLSKASSRITVPLAPLKDRNILVQFKHDNTQRATKRKWANLAMLIDASTLPMLRWVSGGS
jgi:hypothetical protein